MSDKLLTRGKQGQGITTPRRSMDYEAGTSRDGEHPPQAIWLTDSSPEDQNEERTEQRQDAADMQARNIAESETDARKRTILSLPKDKFRGDTKESPKIRHME